MAQEASFDWVVLRDGAVEIPRARNPSWCLSFSGVSPAEIRHRGLAELRRLGYRTAVLTDIDDTFVPGKVSAFVASVDAGADVAYGDLDLCDGEGIVYERGVIAAAGLDRDPGGPLALLRRNFLGLSHTAFALEWLDRVGDPPPGCYAYDWWLFTSLLALGAKVRFVAGAETRYVQGETLFQPSLDGPPEVRQALTPRRLALAHRVKLAHYRWLVAQALQWGAPPRYRDAVASELSAMEDLATHLDSGSFVASYIASVNRGWRALPRGWWGAIVSAAEAGSIR